LQPAQNFLYFKHIDFSKLKLLDYGVTYFLTAKAKYTEGILSKEMRNLFYVSPYVKLICNQF